MNEAFHGVGIGDIKLFGSRMSARLEEAVTSAEIQRTIEGASTLTLDLKDPTYTILRSPLLRQRTRVTVDPLTFELVQVRKTGTLIKATFEDAKVAALRLHKGFNKVSRDKMTRAEFIRMLVREEKGISFFSPQLTKKQQSTGLTKKDKFTQSNQRREKGYGPLTNLEVQNKPATQSQKDTLETVVSIGYEMKAEDVVILSAIETVIVESVAGDYVGPNAPNGVRAPTGKAGDGSSAGIFQQTPEGGYGPQIDRVDDEKASRMYYERAIKNHQRFPNMNAGDLAAYTQNPRADLRYKYGQWEGEAKAALSAYRGGADENRPLVPETYEFQRGQPYEFEDTWTCIQRLAAEVNWHCFMLGSTLYYVSDDDLIRSRPRMALGVFSQGVDVIDFDWDVGKRSTQVIMQCEAERWFAPPGSVIELKDVGPADGRWIVANIRKDMASTHCEITLKRYAQPKLEPVSFVTAPTLESMSDAEINSLVKLGPGADRPEQKTNQWVFDFLRRVAAQAGTKTIWISTGTRHNQYVKGSTHQSDHWLGNAADIGSVLNHFNDATYYSGPPRVYQGVPAPGGDKIAAAAMTVAGENEAAAKKKAAEGSDISGGSWNYVWTNGGQSFRINILWKTDVGGNHYDHVHIGVKPTGAGSYTPDKEGPTVDTELSPSDAFHHRGDAGNTTDVITPETPDANVGGDPRYPFSGTEAGSDGGPGLSN